VDVFSASVRGASVSVLGVIFLGQFLFRCFSYMFFLFVCGGTLPLQIEEPNRRTLHVELKT